MMNSSLAIHSPAGSSCGVGEDLYGPWSTGDSVSNEPRGCPGASGSELQCSGLT